MPIDCLDGQMWKYIFMDFMEELHFLPYALRIGSVIFIILWYCHRKSNSSYQTFLRNIALCLFVVYIIMVLNITLMGRESGSRDAISLTLFETFGGARLNAYVMENIFLFIPFGFFCAVLWQPMRNILLSTFVGFLCSTLIEITQLMTGRGYFQVDDIMTNGLGACIGCILYWGIWGILKNIHD